MSNTVFSQEYRIIVEELLHARTDAGMTQRRLAKALGRSQSHVHRIEQQQRRVDLLEFYRIARALGRDPAELFGAVSVRLEQFQSEGLPRAPTPESVAA